MPHFERATTSKPSFEPLEAAALQLEPWHFARRAGYLCHSQHRWVSKIRAPACVASSRRSLAQAHLWRRLRHIHSTRKARQATTRWCHTNSRMPHVAKSHKCLRSRLSEVIGRSTPELLFSLCSHFVRHRSFGLLTCSGCPISKAGLVRKALGLGLANGDLESSLEFGIASSRL